MRGVARGWGQQEFITLRPGVEVERHPGMVNRQPWCLSITVQYMIFETYDMKARKT